jgi:hypothetical protein
MGKLNGMKAGLEAIRAQTDRQRIIEVFGVDPDLLDKPEEFDPVDARERETSEALCKAIGELGECLEEATEAQAKAIAESIPQGLATDKGIEKSLKAHANVVKLALKDRDNTAVEALLEKVVGLFEESQRLTGLLIAAKQEPEKEEAPVRFDIERDRNGFIASVTATKN